ncbi:MAG: DPP IV N-terminal domain-containing protein [Actinomycetota bacterium]
MADLDERFRSLRRVRPGDLWPEIEQREPRASLGPSPARLIGAVVVALAIAAAGVGLAAVAFRDREEPVPPAVPSAEPRIAFAALSDGRWRIFTMTPDGGSVSRVTPDLPGDPFHAAWSPDGTRIAFDMGSDIYVVDVGTGDVDALTSDGMSSTPAWSPDGTKIAFHRDVSAGNSEIFVMNADGTDPTRLTEDPAFDLGPSWSPDGSRIAFQSNRNGNPDIWVMGSDGSSPTALVATPGYEAFPVWSPDGSRIAFGASRSSAGAIGQGLYVANADGSGVVQLTEDTGFDPSPTWSPNGTRIAFVDRPRGRGFRGVFTIGADGTGLTRLDIPLGGELCCLAWQPVPVGENPSPVETISPVHPDVTATIEVGAFPNAVAIGDGETWVAVSGDDGSGRGEIVRIDESTNEIVSRIQVEAAPIWETGGGGLAVGGGSVWVLGGGDPALLSRIDPSSDAIFDTELLDVETGADVVVSEDAVWTLVFARSDEMAVQRLDPATLGVVATIPVPGIWGQEIFVTPYGIVVHTRDGFPGNEESSVGASRVTMIDPATNQVVWSRADTRFVESFATDGLVWAQSERTQYANLGGETLIRLDPGTGEIVGEPIAVDEAAKAFAVDETGGVWFQRFRDHLWTIERFDPATGDVDAVVDLGVLTDDNAIYPVTVAFDPGSGTIWVVHLRDKVTRIDLG